MWSLTTDQVLLSPGRAGSTLLAQRAVGDCEPELAAGGGGGGRRWGQMERRDSIWDRLGQPDQLEQRRLSDQESGSGAGRLLRSVHALTLATKRHSAGLRHPATFPRTSAATQPEARFMSSCYLQYPSAYLMFKFQILGRQFHCCYKDPSFARYQLSTVSHLARCLRPGLRSR